MLEYFILSMQKKKKIKDYCQRYFSTSAIDKKLLLINILNFFDIKLQSMQIYIFVYIYILDVSSFFYFIKFTTFILAVRCKTIQMIKKKTIFEVYETIFQKVMKLINNY